MMSDEIGFTTVANAAGMAAYEPGRAKPVSVLKATGTNVVVFAFDAGTGLREHVAQQPVLLQALEGTLTVELGNEVVKLRPGDLLHIEPGVPHSVEAVERAKLQLMVLMIDSPGPSKIPMEDFEHPERASGE
jgi:quercetin dioxygenase-like cupin family protein